MSVTWISHRLSASLRHSTVTPRVPLGVVPAWLREVPMLLGSDDWWSAWNDLAHGQPILTLSQDKRCRNSHDDDGAVTSLVTETL